MYLVVTMQKSLNPQTKETHVQLPVHEHNMYADRCPIDVVPRRASNAYRLDHPGMLASFACRTSKIRLLKPSTPSSQPAFPVLPAPTIMVSLLWKGRLKMGGGYPQDPETGYLKLGDKPANAPVMWANGDTPFRFQHWCSGRLTIGGDDDFMVYIGQPGRGENTFWAFQEHFLPESEGVKATLIYRDAADKERQVTCLLKERC